MQTSEQKQRNRLWDRRWKLTMLALSSLLASVPASASHACWVDSVTHTENGVKVDFAHQWSVDVHVVRTAHDSAYSRVEDNGRTLFLGIGDTAHAWQVLEDTCTITAEIRDGKEGVEIANDPHLPRPGPKVDIFLYAQ